MLKYILNALAYCFSISIYGQALKKENLINYSYILNGKDDYGFITSGTGSILHFNGRYYLITNFHVLTGKDANTNKKFPELRDTNTAVTVIFQPIKKGEDFIVMMYSLFDVNGKKNFNVYRFQDQIIDIAVMPIVIPDNALKYCFETVNLTTSKSYKSNESLISFGFPLGQFINNWQPTESHTNAVKNIESGPYMFDPFVFINTTPIKGTSGAPVYFYNEKNQLKVLSVMSNMVDFNIKHPIIKGRSINILYGLDLIKEMEFYKRLPVKGEVYSKNKVN